jgi:hypothetical protein
LIRLTNVFEHRRASNEATIFLLMQTKLIRSLIFLNQTVMPGHDTDLLVDQSFDRELICGVCHELFKDPVFVCAASHTLCKGCADRVNPRMCPMGCNSAMKLEPLQTNRKAANMIDKTEIRCVNRSIGNGNGDGDGDGDGDGGQPVSKKIKTNAGGAAPAPAAADGCEWIGAIK